KYIFAIIYLSAVLLFLAEKHSLYYIYTALSKPVDQPGIYQFTAMGLLDDREIDSYNSKEQKKIPRQQWMKEKMQEDYWEKGTQSRKSKEQWFNVNVDILMKRMRHNESDLHVLQWRHGCEIEKQGDEVKFSKGIDEYSYDGENFLSFDDKESQWVASVDAALPTKRKWDNVPILNQYTKGYLEKECVDWLNKFREYEDLKLRNGSPPDVHVFAKRSFSDKTKLRLTCLATGFYHKDTFLTIRKYCSPLPEDELESTGIRPNHDETFQLRKSVEISEDEKADFDCFVAQRTLKGPIIVRWGRQTKIIKGLCPLLEDQLVSLSQQNSITHGGQKSVEAGLGTTHDDPGLDSTSSTVKADPAIHSVELMYFLSNQHGSAPGMMKRISSSFVRPKLSPCKNQEANEAKSLNP
uniref:Immunoglobulin C1-set domain-containing protein n=1 Tax=Cyprinus carpio TaxID=7962 RepID=A0A8C1S406_CYPCA